MQVVILAGGFGSRLSEETHSLPKPMVRIGNLPMIWHIIKVYEKFGYSDFIVAGGYRVDMISKFINANQVSNLNVRVVDTGLNTQTAGRILRIAKYINGDFMLTYGDGLSNLDINVLKQFHYEKGKLATVTAVHPPPRFGTLELHGDDVRAFHEKNQVMEGWINGGFMVFHKKVIEMIVDDNEVLERTILPWLAESGQLSAFRHDGWWYAMDTLRDKNHLNSLWQANQAPWVHI